MKYLVNYRTGRIQMQKPAREQGRNNQRVESSRTVMNLSRPRAT